MDVLLKIVGFSLVIGMSSALFCAQCTYKAGTNIMPEVMGVTYLPRGSSSDSPACKSGEGELNVVQCHSKDHVSCYTRIFTYNTTTYYQRGCTSYCHTLPEITVAKGMEMTQLCCDEGARCNHPSNDGMLLQAARNTGKEQEFSKEGKDKEYHPEGKNKEYYPEGENKENYPEGAGETNGIPLV